MREMPREAGGRVGREQVDVVVAGMFADALVKAVGR